MTATLRPLNTNSSLRSSSTELTLLSSHSIKGNSLKNKILEKTLPRGGKKKLGNSWAGAATEKMMKNSKMRKQHRSQNRIDMGKTVWILLIQQKN